MEGQLKIIKGNSLTVQFKAFRYYLLRKQ